jgi:hypothetical protein
MGMDLAVTRGVRLGGGVRGKIFHAEARRIREAQRRRKISHTKTRRHEGGRKGNMNFDMV